MKKTTLIIGYLLIATNLLHATQSMLKENSLIFKNGGGFIDDGVNLSIANSKHFQITAEIAEPNDIDITENHTIEGNLLLDSSAAPNITETSGSAVFNNMYLGTVGIAYTGFCNNNVASKATDYALGMDSNEVTWVNCKDEGKIQFCFDGVPGVTFSGSNSEPKVGIGFDITEPTYTLEVEDGILIPNGERIYLAGCDPNSDPVFLERYNSGDNAHLRTCVGDTGGADNDDRVSIGIINDSGEFEARRYIYGATGTTTLASDRRFKTNINPIKNALQKTLQLNPCKFYWKTEQKKPKYKHFGLIAQEVEKILPKIVITNNNFKTITYSSLYPVLLEALKEQNKLISDQEKEINLLLKKATKIKQNQQTKRYIKKLLFWKS